MLAGAERASTGKTIVMVTHDPRAAERAKRTCCIWTRACLVEAGGGVEAGAS